MSGPVENDDARELRRLTRVKSAALMNRDSTVDCIKSIHALSERVEESPALLAEFLVAIGDLDSLWNTFILNQQAVIDALLDLDTPEQFTPGLQAEIRALYTQVVMVADRYKSSSTAESTGHHDGSQAGSIASNKVDVNSVRSRLPEIPLPSYSGDLSGWPVFRDRFNALVAQRNDLSNIERFYYLLGCLKGDALHAIRNIAVSENTYALAWSTLVDRFDKPRQLATLIVDKLISIPAQSQESLVGLKEFLVLFSDQVATLDTLNIPNLGEFLLFALSARCLPLSIRKGFEAINVLEFPTASDMVQYVKSRVSILEAVQFSSSSRRQTTQGSTQLDRSRLALHRQGDKRSKVTLLTSKTASASASKCVFCSQDHVSDKCLKFMKLSLDARFQAARDKRLCFRCLNSTHWSSRCKVSKPCDHCTGRHHTLLHRENHTPEGPLPETSLNVSALDQPTVLLGTALVHVRDQAGCMQSVRALIDSASQISVMTTSCVERLGLKRKRWTAPLMGLSGVALSNVSGLVECTITPRYDDHNIQVNAWILPKITGNMPARRLTTQFSQRFAHLALADPHFDRPDPVDLLLGADVFSQIMNGKRIVIDDSSPAAFGSVFGWIIIGSVEGSAAEPYRSNVVSLTVSLEDIVQRFWHIEEPDAIPETFTADGQCEAIYEAERIRDVTGRYVVPLPFLNDHQIDTFPGSRQMAIRRFQNLEKRLQNDPDLGLAYRNFMEEYESLGHMSVAPCPGSYYIPHHPVCKGSPASSKIRVVFDASATASNKSSLNQCLHTGPKLQLDIIDSLLRFRVHQYTFTADVCKMYRQILVLPKYRKFQHIFWRASPLDKLKEYQLNTVTYGVNCAPYLALRVLRDIADQECSDTMDVRDTLMHQTYVDDICVGADSTDELVRLQSELQLVLGRAGMELKKWSSNSPCILSAVSPEDRATDVTHFTDNDKCVTKVLGLQWDPTTDVFGFRVQPSAHIPTKRSVLSIIARIYDPIEFLAPVIFYAKHIMQQIWKTCVSWDDPLPPGLVSCWHAFVDDLPALSQVQIPRFLFTQMRCHIQLCGFCDASERGYSAVVYLRLISPHNSVSISLLGSKTKMAPMKTSTVPRLELCAAVLLARWMSRLQATLTNKIVVDDVFAWSDSQRVLSWLVKPHTMFKIFVSNRVHQIQQLLPQCKWGYIRTNINPADCASRGMLPSDLINHSLYWSGPEFLSTTEEGWNLSPVSLPADQLPDVKPVSLAVHLDEPQEWICRFSAYDRMLRVVSWIRRFIGCCRGHKYVHTFLTRTEIHDSLLVIVRSSQRLFFPELYAALIGNNVPSRVFARLRPFVDSNDLIRVGGRLCHSELSDFQKQPMLLPKTSHLAKLITHHWHWLRATLVHG